MPPKKRLNAEKNQTVLTHLLCSGKTADNSVSGTEDSSTSRPMSDSGTAAADSCARPTTVSASTCSTKVVIPVRLLPFLMLVLLPSSAATSFTVQYHYVQM